MQHFCTFLVKIHLNLKLAQRALRPVDLQGKNREGDREDKGKAWEVGAIFLEENVPESYV